MATVTGMTAAAMSAIRDGSITGAHFDSANHLILTKYDGTTIDGGLIGAATTTLAGPVELATNAETQAGTDAVRAVTPAGLASLPGTRVQILGTPLAETALQSAYPVGVSMMDTSAWTLNGGYGTVVTNNESQWRCQQTFYSASGGTSYPRAWIRHYNTSDGGGGWTGWRELSIVHPLTAANYNQTSAFTTYPQGWSRLYYTTATSTGWDFSGWAGEVMTFCEGTDFARQIFTRHSSLTNPEMWIRTANSSNGWSTWQKLMNDPGAWVPYTPTWTSQGSVQPSLGNAVLNCKYQKISRTVNVKFWINFGSTTNFGSSPTTGDNWQFSLPVTAANAADDGLGFLEMYWNSTNYGLGRVKLYSTGGFRLGVSAGSTAGIGGDVDSITPWTWVSGNYLRGTFTYESAS